MKTLEIGNLVRQVTKLDEETSGINLARLCAGEGRNLLDVLGVATVAQAGAALKAKSDAKDYTGLMLGDYLDITSDYEGVSHTVRYEIVAFGHYHMFYNGSDIEYGLGNITFLAKTVVYEKRINPTYSSTSERQYSNSELRGILNGSIYNSLKSALGVDFKRILQYQQFNDGTSNSPDWQTDAGYDGDDIYYDKQAEYIYLPSSREILGEKGWGCEHWDNSHQFTALALDNGRIPCKNEAGNYKWFWNRTPSQIPGYFCYVDYYGYAYNVHANFTYGGVRPAFNL